MTTREKCEHETLKTGRRMKQVANEVFRYSAQVCAKCGAEYWNQDLEKEFGIWLSKQKADKFKVQKVKVSAAVYKTFSDYSLHVGKGDVSFVLRAALNVFMQKIANSRSAEVAETIEHLYAAEKGSGFLEKGVKEKAFRLNGRLYVDLESFARLADMSMAQAAAEILGRVAVALKKHSEMVRHELEYVLRAS